MQIKKRVGAVFLLANTLLVNASPLDNALVIQQTTNDNSASTQTRISSSADHSLQLQAEIEQLRLEVENLELYGHHLSSLTASQQQEITSLNNQIADINLTRQGVVPLMYRMINGLQTHVANDLPIKAEQRQQRIAKLQAMISRADVSDAEKYRRILEAYQIELDYGIKLATFRDAITVDNDELQVEVVHLGRVSLVARSLNGVHFWYWNQQRSEWQPLASELKPELDKAFTISAQQTTPGLLKLPISLAVAEDK